MIGYYLYCVRERMNTPPPVTQGIGGSEVKSVCIQPDLEAVISEVNAETFSSEEIQERAQEDVGWIKEHAQLHEQVIEQAMETADGHIVPVIPMQFGVVFKTQHTLKRVLGRNHHKFIKSLTHLKGKQEWGVKAYLQEERLKKAVEQDNDAVTTKRRELESMSRGAAFFAQKALEEVVNQEKEKESEKITGEIEEKLNQWVVEQNHGKLLDSEFTGKPEAMILNIFYLVEESKVGQFQTTGEQLNEKYKPHGLTIELNGPWPPYHFVWIGIS